MANIIDWEGFERELTHDYQNLPNLDNDPVSNFQKEHADLIAKLVVDLRRAAKEEFDTAGKVDVTLFVSKVAAIFAPALANLAMAFDHPEEFINYTMAATDGYLQDMLTATQGDLKHGGEEGDRAGNVLLRKSGTIPFKEVPDA